MDIGNLMENRISMNIGVKVKIMIGHEMKIGIRIKTRMGIGMGVGFK